MPRLVLLVLALTACGSSRTEPNLTASPRLITSYILTTINNATVDFEGIREAVCDTERDAVQGLLGEMTPRLRRDLVGLCQRAERVRAHLHYAQLQLTRLLGDAPDHPGVIIPGTGR